MTRIMMMATTATCGFEMEHSQELLKQYKSATSDTLIQAGNQND